MHLSRRSLIKGAASLCGTSLVEPYLKAVPLDGRDARTLRAYFLEMVPSLLRNAEGSLAFSSLAISPPGKNYSTELWDWDTLWTIQGLLTLANWPEASPVRQSLLEHARGSLMNFFDHQAPDGRIPIMVSVSDNDPFRTLGSQHPLPSNQAKPVFAQIGLLISRSEGSTAWLGSHFDRLLQFYRSWRLQNLSDTGLFVWSNDVAIGDDNDPTTFGRPFFSSANLMLNCMFYQEFKAAAVLADGLHRADDAEALRLEADHLAQAIERHCWEPRDDFYYTVDTQCLDRRAGLLPAFPRGMDMSWSSLRLRVQMFTGFMPLWCGFPTKDRASRIVRSNYLRDDRFRCAYGIRSLSNQEPMYSLATSGNPSNWLGPVWTLANYFLWSGLTRYGFSSEASELATKTAALLATDLKKSGSLNEYYHPDTGAPLSHSGFVDWNLLVLEML